MVLGVDKAAAANFSICSENRRAVISVAAQRRQQRWSGFPECALSVDVCQRLASRSNGRKNKFASPFVKAVAETVCVCDCCFVSADRLSIFKAGAFVKPRTGNIAFKRCIKPYTPSRLPAAVVSKRFLFSSKSGVTFYFSRL